MRKKRAYYVGEEGEEYGIAVVAYSAREAKKLGFHDDLFADTDWIDMRTTWKQGVDVSEFQIGIISNHLLALKLRVYGYILEETCPHCKSEDVTVYYDNGRYYCSNCN